MPTPFVSCHSDGDCPFLFHCTADNQCLHDPVFPLQGYPILVYCLFPLASAICNLSGNSFGEYKVLLLMDALDYPQNLATTLAYPLIVGTALFNVGLLVTKRHPSKDTSLVDFNIIMVLIPNILYGSTIGALVNNFVPSVVADVLIAIILGAFSVKFWLRFYHFWKEGKQKEQEKEPRASEIQLGPQSRQTLQKSLLNKSNEPQPEILQQKVNPYQAELSEVEAYQATYHWKHIFLTILIFLVFEVCSFLAQGKIIPFSICSFYYIIGICCLTVLYGGFLVAMFFYTKRKMEFYRKIQYDYEVRLDRFKNYFIVCLGGFMGGFNGGVFSLGSSTSIIFTLLFLGIEPMVVSATVGFQVVFAGLASLAQAFVTGSITIEVAGFFLLVTFIGGGILSFVANRIVSKLNKNRVNQILMIIVGSLTGVSSMAVVVNIVTSYIFFGSNYMISIDYSC